MNDIPLFQVSISCWRHETISINVHKTPVECFEYTVAPSGVTGGLSQRGQNVAEGGLLVNGGPLGNTPKKVKK